MPRLGKSDQGPYPLQDRIIEIAEREAKELAAVGISMLAEAVKRRLGRSRASPAAGENGHGPMYAPTPRADSPYHILGVAPDAPLEEIERVFRKRVMACHPDRGGDEEELRQVLVAIREIRSERKR